MWGLYDRAGNLDPLEAEVPSVDVPTPVFRGDGPYPCGRRSVIPKPVLGRIMAEVYVQFAKSGELETWQVKKVLQAIGDKIDHWNGAVEKGKE